MSYKQDRSFYFSLIRIFIVVATAGVAALIYTSLQNDPTELAFSLIAFIISVAALIMTTLQSLTIARQLRVTERAAELVRESSSRIEVLTQQDGELAKEIHKDVRFDREIIAALEELGLGESAEERHKAAAHIKKRVTRHE